MLSLVGKLFHRVQRQKLQQKTRDTEDQFKSNVLFHSGGPERKKRGKYKSREESNQKKKHLKISPNWRIWDFTQTRFHKDRAQRMRKPSNARHNLATFQYIRDEAHNLTGRKNKWSARLRFSCGFIYLFEAGLMVRSLAILQ